MQRRPIYVRRVRGRCYDAESGHRSNELRRESANWCPNQCLNVTEYISLDVTYSIPRRFLAAEEPAAGGKF